MSWFSVLEAVRSVASAKNRNNPTKALFTAAEVATEAEIQSTEKSPATWIASGWLGKFVRWGYVVRAPKIFDDTGSIVRAYRVTAWGLKKYAPKGPQEKRAKRKRPKKTKQRP